MSRCTSPLIGLITESFHFSCDVACNRRIPTIWDYPPLRNSPLWSVSQKLLLHIHRWARYTRSSCCESHLSTHRMFNTCLDDFIRERPSHECSAHWRLQWRPVSWLWWCDGAFHLMTLIQASIIGKKYGRRRWPRTKKTVEGTIAFAVALMVGAFGTAHMLPLLTLFNNHLNHLNWPKFIMSTFLTGSFFYKTANNSTIRSNVIAKWQSHYSRIHVDIITTMASKWQLDTKERRKAVHISWFKDI